MMTLIRVKREFIPKESVEGLDEYVSDKLKGIGHEYNIPEEALRQAENVSTAFGKLLDILLQKKLISLEEIKHIVDGHEELEEI